MNPISSRLMNHQRGILSCSHHCVFICRYIPQTTNAYSFNICSFILYDLIIWKQPLYLLEFVLRCSVSTGLVSVNNCKVFTSLVQFLNHLIFTVSNINLITTTITIRKIYLRWCNSLSMRNRNRIQSFFLLLGW